MLSFKMATIFRFAKIVAWPKFEKNYFPNKIFSMKFGSKYTSRFLLMTYHHSYVAASYYTV